MKTVTNSNQGQSSVKKIVLACSLDEKLLDQLKKIKNYGFGNQVEFHLVHVFESRVYTDGFNSYYYPGPSDEEKIRGSVESKLKNFAKNSLGDFANIHVKCLFSPNEKKEIVDYLKQNHVDLVVTATQGKHGIAGLFSSSFTEYLMKFAPCDILVFRPLT